MLKQFFIFITIGSLAACATATPNMAIQAAEPAAPIAASEVSVQQTTASEPVAPETVAPTQPESLPYPKLDPQEQIDKLTLQINRLKQQMAQINTRIQQLERRNTTPIMRPPKPKPQTRVALPESLKQPIELTEEKEIQTAPISPLEQAQKFYTQGNYRAVLTQLRGDDGGGDGSPEAQQKMWLLLQSNQKLQKCQSVIHIGQRFVSRFANHENAPEALFTVGQCQWAIQQQDIARDTWHDLIRRYPNSPFVAKAAQAIKRPK